MEIRSVEDAVVLLGCMRNMLQLFEEHMDDELASLEKDGNAIARHFVSRYDLLRSQMDMIQIAVTDISKGLSRLDKEGAA